MKSILFLILLILAVLVGYTYFFGKGEDKEQAREIVRETRDLGRSVGDFLKRQKEKYDDGDFDRLLDRLSSTLNKLKSNKSDNTTEEKEELRSLENELRQIDPEKLNVENRERLRKLLNELETELETGK